MSSGRIAFAVASASLVAWCALALGRGRYWEAKVDEVRGLRPLPYEAPHVEVIVPARNEARTIGAAVRSLARQCYDGAFAITLVDDDSDDDTAALAAQAVAALAGRARLHTIAGRPLHAPWTGKLNALDVGVAHVRATRGTPAYWLFTDADIEHHPFDLAELVAKAQRDDLDLVSLMVRLRCESPWEKLLIPAFVYFFAKLYPFGWSNDPRRSTAAAAGGCVLLRASALERIGGLQAIAGDLIDDCALARAVKRTGGRTWLGLSSQTTSIRDYETLESIWSMVKRSAFTQLEHSYAATAAATLAMGFLYVVPPALTITAAVRREPRAALAAGAAWALMAALYRPTQRAYERPVSEAFALPVAATLYMAMTIDSAVAHARGRGGLWKGRTSA